MSLFWSKDALFWSEMHHMLSYSVVLYCTVFLLHCLVYFFVNLWYCMVLHCMIWYLMLSILHTFAFFALSHGLCLARRLFPPSTHLAQPTHPTHLDHLAQPTHPNQSTLLIWIIRLIQLNPPIRLVICYLSFVICHLSFVIWYFLFAICLFVICCIVVDCIAWYIFCYLMVLHGNALYDLVFYIIYFAFFCVFRFVAWAVSRKTPIPLILFFCLSPFIKRQRAMLWLNKVGSNFPEDNFFCFFLAHHFSVDPPTH